MTDLPDNLEHNEVQEDKDLMLHIRLAPDTYRQYKAVCALLNKSMTQCANELIDAFLSENKLIV